MKITNLTFSGLLITLLITVSLADEKKLKFRDNNNSETLKPIQISISPDLLNLKKAKELKNKYKVAKEFAIKTDQSLKKKKKIKFRGSAKKIYKDYANSVVFLYNPTEGKESLGAGFLVDKSGVILTNWHVTNGAKEIFVWPLPKEGAVEAEVLFKDIDPYFGYVLAENKEQDLALVKVSGLALNAKVVEFGNNEDVSIGDTVYAIGHPNGLPWSFTLGTVSQIRKNKKWNYGEGDEDKSEHLATVIQTQTPISPGNSGGPLFGDSGKIVGINTWGADGQNLNFAVAADHAKEFIKANPSITKINTVDEVIKKEYPNARTDDYNKNGVIDTWYIDENKNGKIDLGFIDDDENGFVEGTLIDEDEDGVWEIFLIDTDENGKADQAYLDNNADKKPDVLAHDYNEDGEWDKFEELT
ncbi:MAG: trypsin-like peptidase domain-containing protein [Pelagibacteraceae bacterium]|nr:trypsin-like peptidase domain-containing protein [Pelagibacteraceae bacterium]